MIAPQSNHFLGLFSCSLFPFPFSLHFVGRGLSAVAALPKTKSSPTVILLKAGLEAQRIQPNVSE